MWLMILLIFAPPILAGLIFSLRLGLRAVRYQRAHKSTSAALRWIILMLCEPCVNFIVIGCMTFADLQADLRAFEPNEFVRTLPMIVVLLPAIDLWAANPIQRKIAVYALSFGIARWLTAITIHASVGVPGEGVAPFFFCLLVGTALLWASALWSRAQLRAIMHNEAYTVQEARA